MNRIAGVFLLILSLTQVWGQKSAKPNVLLIYTDDHRFSGVHALANMDVKTPNIDKLVEEGISFDNTYLMGAFSGATCMPSRAMLLSGKQLFHLTDIGHVLPEKDVTIGEAFHRAGYESMVVGKWHQDRASLARSFDKGGRLMGLGLYLTDHYRMPFWDWNKDPEKMTKEYAYLLQYDENGKLYKRALTPKDKRGPVGTEKTGPHDNRIFADDAIRLIREHRPEKPFFMYLAFHSPHDPRQAPRKFQKMYKPEKIQLPPSYMAQHPFDNGHMYLRDELLAPWPRTPEVTRKELADYYAFITYLDDEIGRVIKALKESGQYENTIIALAGDSGLGVGCHGLMGKQNVYDEDGLHVPFIVSGGAVPLHGKRFDALAYIHDIYPTLCDFAGVEIPGSVEGKSLLPVVKGETKQVRDYTYHAYRQFQRAYRSGDYKLIEYVRAPNFDRKGNPSYVSGSRVTQLFNVKNDPWEVHDLSFMPEYFPLIDSLRAAMQDKAKQLDDSNKITGEPVDFWDYY